jgi:hypothetical protein
MFSKEHIEKLNSSRLADVKPELAEKCRAIIAQATSEGFNLELNARLPLNRRAKQTLPDRTGAVSRVKSE